MEITNNIDSIDPTIFTEPKESTEPKNNAVGYLQDLKLRAQMEKRSAPTFPTDFSLLNHEFIFFNEESCKLYAPYCNLNSDNVIDMVIKIRQGNFVWNELLYDEETKVHSFGETIDPKNELVEYPTNVIKDLVDIVSNIYLKFDYTDDLSKQFLNDFKKLENKFEIIQNYILTEIPDYLKNTKEFLFNLNNAMLVVLHHNFTK